MTDINDILNGKTKKITKISSKKIVRKSGSSDDTSENEIDKGGRPRKDVVYAKERKEILDIILKILSVSKTGDIFYISDLDDDIEKQNKILELENDIKKYFSASGWKCMTEEGVLKKYVSIVKYILKHMNIKLSAVSLIVSDTRKVLRQGYLVIF